MTHKKGDDSVVPAMLTTANPQAWGGLKGRLFAFLRLCYLLASSFLAHQGPLRAAALTYTTILSLIPVLAIAFAVLKGLGVQNALEPMLRELAGDSEEIVAKVISYVNNTNFKSIGAIGVTALFLTVLSLLSDIDDAFNVIWGVRETRSLKRRFSDYLSVVLVGPIMLLVATSMTSGLQSQRVVQWLIEFTYLGDAILLLFRLVPYISIWIALIFLYSFIPNTKVRFRSAIIGGVIAGTFWEIAQWGYFYFQVGVANYNAIYGTLAALPVFLVWIFTSWLIVLFGVEVVCAHQRHRYGAAELLPPPLSTAAREELSLAILLQVCRHFRDDNDPPVAESLSDELGIPAGQMAELLGQLLDLGYLLRTDGDEPGWLPAHEPSAIRVSEVLAALRGESSSAVDAPPSLLLAGEILRRGQESRQTTLEGVTLHDLLATEGQKA